jgi:hypothetical protein
MKYLSLTAITFGNTGDECFLQQGAGGGYGAVLSGGKTIKANRSALNPKTKSSQRQKAESALNPFGGNTYAGASQRFSDRQAMAKAKLAGAAVGTAGVGTFTARGRKAGSKSTRPLTPPVLNVGAPKAKAPKAKAPKAKAPKGKKTPTKV